MAPVVETTIAGSSRWQKEAYATDESFGFPEDSEVGLNPDAGVFVPYATARSSALADDGSAATSGADASLAAAASARLSISTPGKPRFSYRDALKVLDDAAPSPESVLDVDRALDGGGGGGRKREGDFWETALEALSPSGRRAADDAPPPPTPAWAPAKGPDHHTFFPMDDELPTGALRVSDDEVRGACSVCGDPVYASQPRIRERGARGLAHATCPRLARGRYAARFDDDRAGAGLAEDWDVAAPIDRLPPHLLQ